MIEIKNITKLLIICTLIIISILIIDLISYKKYKLGKYIFFTTQKQIVLNEPIEGNNSIELEEAVYNIVKKYWINNSYFVESYFSFQGENIVKNKGVYEYYYQFVNNSLWGPKYMECEVKINTIKQVVDNIKIYSISENSCFNRISYLDKIDINFAEYILKTEKLLPTSASFFSIFMNNSNIRIIYVQNYIKNEILSKQPTLIEWQFDTDTSQLQKVKDYRSN